MLPVEEHVKTMLPGVNGDNSANTKPMASEASLCMTHIQLGKRTQQT